jgi:hypothetical protein
MYNNQKFYFCSDTYPPTKDGLKSLKDALIVAAHDAGAKIISSGGTHPKLGLCLVLRCSCSQLYQSRGSKVKKFDKENQRINQLEGYRTSVLHNDRKENRKDGKQTMKRTVTGRCMSKGDPSCPFRIPVYNDESGYFIKAGNGCSTHQYHLKLDPNGQEYPSVRRTEEAVERH